METKINIATNNKVNEANLKGRKSFNINIATFANQKMSETLLDVIDVKETSMENQEDSGSNVFEEIKDG